MWRKTWQDRVMSHIQENSSLYIFNAVLLLMGVIFGAILVNSLQLNQKQDLSFYLQRFFGQVSKGEFAIAGEMFRESYFSQLKYIGFIWILGISIIGLPLIFYFIICKRSSCRIYSRFLSKSAWMEWIIISIRFCIATKSHYHPSISRYDNNCRKFFLTHD